MRITEWMCALLLSYSNRKSSETLLLTSRDLSLKEKLNALHEVIPEVLNCSPLFLRTNYDNKIDSFNLLKKQTISVVLRLNALGVSIQDKEKRELLTKRCRRCIKVFNNDDFYYFFANIEEETDLLFSLFDPSDSSVSFHKGIDRAYRYQKTSNAKSEAAKPPTERDRDEIREGVSSRVHRVAFA